MVMGDILGNNLEGFVIGIQKDLMYNTRTLGRVLFHFVVFFVSELARFS